MIYCLTQSYLWSILTLERISSTCKHVLVDEFQDTNKIQAILCEHFSSFHQNLTVVGDDAQSITLRLTMKTYCVFPMNLLTQNLSNEENYRSSPEILDVANAF